MNKDPCEQTPTHIRHWPGKPHDFVCKDHADDTEKIAEAIGWAIPLVEIPETLPDFFFRATGITGDPKTCACTQGRVQTVSTG